jgi:DNA-binding NtrC family response regulator
MRAQRCYEMAKLAPEFGHTKLYCERSCQECDYYRHVHKQDMNIMVVTADEKLSSLLKSDLHGAPYNLEITDCEYSCSALVDRFRADYVVIDCSLGSERTNDICSHLLEDPRLPYVRVVLAVDRGEYPEDCDKNVFARIEKPFLISDITRCLDGTQNERGMAVSRAGTMG